MKQIIIFFLTFAFAGCTGSIALEEHQKARDEYLVSCSPHIFYCYRKSDLICYRGYRVIKASISEKIPEMIIKCN